jgi:hypothetical protein
MNIENPKGSNWCMTGTNIYKRREDLAANAKGF